MAPSGISSFKYFSFINKIAEPESYNIFICSLLVSYTDSFSISSSGLACAYDLSLWVTRYSMAGRGYFFLASSSLSLLPLAELLRIALYVQLLFFLFIRDRTKFWQTHWLPTLLIRITNCDWGTNSDQVDFMWQPFSTWLTVCNIGGIYEFIFKSMFPTEDGLTSWNVWNLKEFKWL